METLPTVQIWLTNIISCVVHVPSHGYQCQNPQMTQWGHVLYYTPLRIQSSQLKKNSKKKVNFKNCSILVMSLPILWNGPIGHAAFMLWASVVNIAQASRVPNWQKKNGGNASVTKHCGMCKSIGYVVTWLSCASRALFFGVVKGGGERNKQENLCINAKRKRKYAEICIFFF